MKAGLSIIVLVVVLATGWTVYRTRRDIPGDIEALTPYEWR